MKEEIIKLCQSIKENNRCENCTGRFDNHTCIYCGNESETLKELISKLTTILDNITIDNEILINLYSIKSLNVEKVNKILNENNYEEKLKSKYSEICNKINDNNLNDDDHKYMLYFIENNIIANDTNLLINILMRKMILDKLNLDNSSKLMLIKKFTEMFMKDFMKGRVKNPKCVFDSLKKDTIGNSFFDRITLDEKEINEMLENKQYVKILMTIFHECTHTNQYYTMSVEKSINYNNLLQTKEEIIRSSNQNYYDENYEIYSSEVEARCMENYLTLQYLQSIGVSTNKEEYMKKEIIKEQELYFNLTRKNNKIDTTVDEMFMSTNDVKSLLRYPVLKVQFKIENNTLIMKNEQELIDDYNNYKSGILKLNGNPNEIEYLYNYLINNMKQNKERS